MLFRSLFLSLYIYILKALKTSNPISGNQIDPIKVVLVLGVLDR